jgi:hypothetical protein
LQEEAAARFEREHMEPAKRAWLANGGTLEEFEAAKPQLRKEKLAGLLDIRYAARSRVPHWNKGALQKLLGERYVHVPALGNVRYKLGPPIEIADYAAGRAAIEACEYHAVVLLCACADAATCHRSTVGDLLKADGYEVVEMDAAQQREILHSSPGQLPLFD